MKCKDILGERFGRLIVVEKAGPNTHRKMRWLCRCDCGNQLIVLGDSLRNGRIQSCGCLQKELTSKRFSTHNKSEERIYRIWKTMKNRCNNPNYKWYVNYGGRGIKVCDEWQKFESFYEWSMVSGYTETLTLDRINFNGNYEPSNCRWVDMVTQNNNKRTNHRITFNNETHTMKEWSRILGIKYSVLENRLNKYKWSVEKAFER